VNRIALYAEAVTFGLLVFVMVLHGGMWWL
jgi:hypothetical protein